LFLFSIERSFAGIDPTYFSQTGPFKASDSYSFQDQKFVNDGSWTTFTNRSDQEAISLRVVDQVAIGFAFSYKVSLKVDCWSDPAKTTDADATTYYPTLTVNYDPKQGVSYQGMSTFNFKNAFSVRITVQSVGPANTGDTQPGTGMVELTGNIMADRVYNFQPATPVNVTTFSPVNNSSQLSLGWDFITGAEEYDVEWTTIDAGDPNEAIITGNQVNNAAVLFKNNASRITTAGHTYTIDLPYNDDYLLVRIRQAQYDLSGLRQTGAWTYVKSDGTLMESALSWHQPGFNWQYSAAFAEEGKKKGVISYFDGTLRNRQTVTVNNSDNVPLIQENVYDMFGRPFASILPAPAKETDPQSKQLVNNPFLHYFQNLNLNASKSPYNYNDVIGSGSLSCEVSPAPLDPSSGTSKYYSPNNDYLTDFAQNYHKYIPDAGGYPLSVTQYTPDNTGRIRMQGGVGPAFQPGLNNPSHTTKYYYGKPEQWELDQLFGNDVGYAEHYMKNMVVDANNQVSISYVNASGKTIATALSGGSPANLSALPAEPVGQSAGSIPSTVTFHVLKPAQFVFDASALTITGTTTYLASTASDVNFSYDTQQLLYTFTKSGSSSQICSSCYYDLKITVIDPCNPTIPVYSQVQPIGAKLGDPLPTASKTGSFTAKFANIGEYYITFQLVMSQSVMNDYLNNFITTGESNGMLASQWTFVQKYLTDLDLSGVLGDCRTNQQLLGTLDDFKTMCAGKLSAKGIDVTLLNATDLASYNQWVSDQYTKWSDFVNNSQTGCQLANCDPEQSLMLKDVSPGGQYALFYENTPLEVTLNVVNNNYRTVFPVLPATSPTYIANSFTRDDGSVSSANDAHISAFDIAKYWKANWAQLFLPFHPEYCKLHFCNDYTPTYGNWDERVKQMINTAADIAKIPNAPAGFAYDYNNGSWLVAADPFFQAHADLAASMMADLNNYSTNVLGITGQTVKNLSQYISYSLYCSFNCGANDTNCWNNCTPSCQFPDRDWAVYKASYFQLKQKYLDQYRAANYCPNNCTVGSPMVISAPYGSAASSDTSNPGDICNGTSVGVTFKVQLDSTKKFLAITAHLCRPVAADVQISFDPSYTQYGVVTTMPRETITIGAGSQDASFVDGQALEDLYNGPFTAIIAPVSIQPSQVQGVQIIANTTYTDLVWNATDSSSTYSSSSTSSSRTLATANISTASCPTINDFTLNLTPADDLANAPACPIGPDSTYYSSYTVEFLGRSLANTAYVYLYYSPEIDTSNLPAVLTFAPGTTKMYFCLPVGVPLSSVHIQTVNCTGTAPPAYTPVVIPQVNPTTQYVTPSMNDCDYAANSDFFVSDIEVGVTDPSTGQQGTRITVKVKPGVSVCTRNNMVAKVNYTTLTGIASNYYSFSLNIDPTGYVGVAFFPNTASIIEADATGMATPCSTGSSTSGCDMAYSLKTSRFGQQTSMQNMPGSSADAFAQFNAEIPISIANSCEGNADRWMTALAPGLTAYDAPTIANLRAALVKFCEDNGDISHLNGASTLNPGLNTNPDAPYTTFGDILKDKLSLTLTGFTSQLNPWLFESPAPYTAPQQQAAPVTISNSNAQIAATLASLYQNYQAAATGNTFYAYLQQMYGVSMSLSADDLTALQNASASCNYILPYDIVLPAFLQPNQQGCLTVADYTSAKNDLLANFPNGLPATDPNYLTILTNYMNQRFGFTLGVDDYEVYDKNPTGTLCTKPAFADATPLIDPYANIENQLGWAVTNGLRDYDTYIRQQRELFIASYVATCSAAQANVFLTAPKQNYHYTLYYYDQADNLVRTVPPEGVHLITDLQQLQQIQQARDNPGDPAACSASYKGPTSTDMSGALSALSTLLAGGHNSALELWFYNSQPGGEQLSLTTADGLYQVQLNISSTTLSADIYSQPDPGGFKMSNHVTVSLTSLPALQSWVHIVVQSTNLLSAPLMVYVNGYKAALINNAVPSYYATNTATIKHLRLYGRLLSGSEIMVNANNSCFVPINTDATWFRFNVPTPGSTNTIAPTSTIETAASGIYPSHTLPTSYVYNATNQVVQQNSPDGGNVSYWYDLLSRLSLSQNDKQLAAQNYSYTQYDALGRITEVGQENNASSTPGAAGYLDNTSINNFIGVGVHSQITHTYYDQPVSSIANVPGLQTSLIQDNNLRKRVSAITYSDNASGPVQQATYYNYDLDGNLSTLWQQIAGLGVKQIDYQYDLISGKVNFVSYQAGQQDQFFYHYKYDAENRLTEAWSGTQAILSPQANQLFIPAARRDAAYYYYLHGPLARVELGDEHGLVQGLDYAYTLHGWLKGVNSLNVAGGNDIGQDGLPGLNQTVAKDAVGYSLGYYTGDYTPIGGAAFQAMGMQYQAATGDIVGQSLYNGNISTSTVSIGQFNTGNPVGYGYHYDQLNRLTNMRQNPSISSGWTSGGWTNNYAEDVNYDGNGNILTYSRNRDGGAAMDALTYNYNRDAAGFLLNNKLNNISDGVSSSGYANDLTTQPAGNYAYDQIGNLVKDQSANIGKADWSVYGKLQNLYDNSNAIKMRYTYDAAGHRASKTNSNNVTTWYVRDAQGNTMAIYDSPDGNNIIWREQHLYGSSRLGLWTPNTVLTSNWTAPTGTYNSGVTLGQKFYELNNHLDNVLATISDKRIQDNNSSGGQVNYVADIITAQDYYPFGMLQPDRQFTANNNSTYRYGFNGKENDNDVGKGTGGEQDYGMRIYDPRMGRFLSVDPLTKSYPQLTPYQFASNDPIESIDADGLERVDYRLLRNRDGTTTLMKISVGSKTDKIYPVYGGVKIAISWMGITKTVPYYVRVEYNGKHYLFADGGNNSKIATDGAGDAYSVNFDANVNYARLLIPFITDPEKFEGEITSEEDGDKITQNRQIKMAVAEAGVEAIVGTATMVAQNGNPEADESNYKYEEGITLKIQPKEEWTEAQMAEAQAKADALTAAKPVVTRKNPVPRISNLRSKFLKAGGVLKSNQHVDHIVELQLGGTNDQSNLQGLDGSVNTSFGSQIKNQIKSVPDGTRIKKVVLLPKKSQGG
jgi:RHS repeat-associated protein